MAYTTIDKPSDYFETILYSGNGGTQSITSLDFQPDWCWLKARAGDNVSNHRSVDSVRGATEELFQDASAAEETNTNGLTAFNSNGFSLGSSGGTNNSNTTYASWNWKAGTSFTNDASSTGIGSIDSAGSFNNDSGFSIVSYTGLGSNATVKHGMNQKPSMIIFKRRVGSGWNWTTYHKSMGNNYFVSLNTNNAKSNTSSSTHFQDTTPTSSVFSIGDSGHLNGDDIIAYCFAEKQGYSKFGSYAANENVDGTFIYLGFKPAFIILKQTNLARDWHMFDNKRSPFNAVGKYLRPNQSGAEDSGEEYVDFLSNGYKIKNTGNRFNDAGGTYIFMAFSSEPFTTSSGVPATAR